MPNPRVAHSVFCDDVRFELGNKLSFIGVYSSDIVIYQAFPVAIPKFCIQVWVICDVDDVPERLTTILVLPGGHELLRAEVVGLSAPLSPHMREGAQKEILSQTIPFSPLPLMQEGMLEVWVETERERIRAGRIWVKSEALPASVEAINSVVVHPAASQPPS